MSDGEHSDYGQQIANQHPIEATQFRIGTLIVLLQLEDRGVDDAASIIRRMGADREQKGSVHRELPEVIEYYERMRAESDIPPEQRRLEELACLARVAGDLASARVVVSSPHRSETPEAGFLIKTVADTVSAANVVPAARPHVMTLLSEITAPARR